MPVLLRKYPMLYTAEALMPSPDDDIGRLN